MRRLGWIAALVLSLLPAVAGAQGITYKPPAGTGTGSGDIDPSQLSSPGGTVTIGGSEGAATFDTDGTIIPQYSVGTSDPATCTQGGMFHYRSDLDLFKGCKGNAWLSLISTNLTSTSGFGFVVDEDDMSSNSATKVPTQQSVKAYVAAHSGGGGESLTTYDWWEDFAAGGTASGAVGTNGLGFSAIGAGTVSVLRNAGFTDNPGVARITTVNATDNSGAVLYWSLNGSPSVDGDQWNAHNWTVEGVLIPGSNSTAITNAGMFFGLSNTFTTDPIATGSALVGVRWDADRTDSTFLFVVCNSATNGCGSAGDDTNQKTVASTITPSAGTRYYMKIRKVASGVGGNPTVYMSVNGETEKTFCSSGCDDTLGTYTGTSDYAFIFYYSERATGANLSGDVDIMHVNMTGLTRY